jgi:hypothetical protein
MQCDYLGYLALYDQLELFAAMPDGLKMAILVIFSTKASPPRIFGKPNEYVT